MTQTTHGRRALAALGAVGALALGAAAPASAGQRSIHHWVIETTAFDGTTGRIEGWQHGTARRVGDADPSGPRFPWCTPGKPQTWRLDGKRLSVCGRAVPRNSRRTVPTQVANPAELGRVRQSFIDRGALLAAGEDEIGGTRVTVWREADKPGLGPEEERRLALTSVYLDAADGSFVAERIEDVATGKVQEQRVIVDELLRATASDLARSGLERPR